MPLKDKVKRRKYMRDYMRHRRTKKDEPVNPLVIPDDSPVEVQRPPMLLWVALVVAIVFFALAVIRVYY